MKRIVSLLLVLAGAQATADVYRCTGEDGSVTFSQTPCSNAAELVSVETGTSATATSKNCKHAGHFSDAVARLMRQGMDKSDLLDQFGGADAFSRDSMRLVNYVYQFKSAQSMSRERIVSLTTTQCEAGTLGNVGCSALPEKYTQAGGGCSSRFSPGTAAPQAFTFGAANAARAKRDREMHEKTAEQGRKMAEQREKDRRIDACRAEFQTRIDQIQAQMRMGSDPSRHRVELQRLQRKMGECR
ncbi:MAG: DUF4124 domain-containing protein [Woeseiaceae bacterium]|nr:DUF4124 domain-containing protein [Woeseiaceae bacterium]